MMKRKLLPVAIGMAIAGYHGAALSDATVYGKANISANMMDENYTTENGNGTRDKKDNWELMSNASRLGFKGKSKISDDTDAVFKLEYEVYFDDGDDGTGNSSEFNQRNIVAGLNNKKWGQLQAGKHDTPLKMAADGTDQFNDLVFGDINNYMVGEVRSDNIVMYNTPVWNGFTVTVASVLGEEDGVDGTYGAPDAGDDDTQDDGLFDKGSIAIKYAPNDNAWIALSADQNIVNADIVRLNGSFMVGDVTFGGHVQHAEVSNDNLDEDSTDEESGEGIGGIGTGTALGRALDGSTNDWHLFVEEQDAYMVSAKWDITDKWALKGQYGYSESESYSRLNENAEYTDSEFETQQMALGVDYKLNKNVTLFAYTSSIDVDTDNVNFDADKNDADEGDGHFKTAAAGVEVKF